MYMYMVEERTRIQSTLEETNDLPQVTQFRLTQARG
jgi:hypothetical protein